MHCLFIFRKILPRFISELILRIRKPNEENALPIYILQDFAKVYQCANFKNS